MGKRGNIKTEKRLYKRDKEGPFGIRSRTFGICKHMRSFLIVIFLLILSASCAPKYYPAGIPVLESKRELSKYNMELRYGKNEMSGLLLFRTDEEGEIVIHGSTLFGLTIFSFGINGDKWKIYSCIDPLKGKKMQKLLEKDFRKLFLSGEGGKNIKSYPVENDDGKRVVVSHKLLGIEMVFKEIID